MKETAFARGVFHGDARDEDEKETSLQPFSHLLTSQRNSGYPGESCKRVNAYNRTVTHLFAYLRDTTAQYGEARNRAYYRALNALRICA